MTDNEYVNKQAILGAIMAAEPKEENYQLVSSKGYVCETVFVKAHSLWQNIVDIIEDTQPTECKPVVRGEMGNLNDVYISREQAIDAIEREFEDDIMGAVKAKEAVYSVDLADVSMNVCGCWKIEKVKGLHYTENVCSICGTEYRCAYDETLDFKFCPYCGAEMGKESER